MLHPLLLNILTPVSEMLLTGLVLVQHSSTSTMGLVSVIMITLLSESLPYLDLVPVILLSRVVVPELHESLFSALYRCSDYRDLFRLANSIVSLLSMLLPYTYLASALESSTSDVFSISGTYAYAQFTFPILTLQLY